MFRQIGRLKRVRNVRSFMCWLLKLMQWKNKRKLCLEQEKLMFKFKAFIAFSLQFIDVAFSYFSARCKLAIITAMVFLIFNKSSSVFIQPNGFSLSLSFPHTLACCYTDCYLSKVETDIQCSQLLISIHWFPSLTFTGSNNRELLNQTKTPRHLAFDWWS